MTISPKCRYLVIGYSRSGTTVTHLTLMGHPNISALVGELKVSPFFLRGINIFTGGYCTDEERKNGFSAIFNAITTIHANSETNTIGAKTACNSPEHARAIVNVLQNHLVDFKIIHVVRKDLVAQYGSAISGEKSGIMHSWYKGFENRKTEKIKIKKWPFISFLLNNFATYNEFSNLQKSHEVYELKYEDYVRDPQTIHKELFNFLGVADVEVSWLESKKVMPPAEEYIVNYHEMKKLLDELESQYFDNTISPYLLYKAKVLGKFYYIPRYINHLKKKTLS